MENRNKEELIPINCDINGTNCHSENIDSLIDKSIKMFNSNKKLNKIANERLAANREILEILKKAVEERPFYRFGQLLQNLGIINGEDCFYKESTDSLKNAIGYYETKNF